MMIDEILDMMEDMVENASNMPFNPSKIIVDADKLRDCINDLRLHMPKELRDAQHIVYDRNAIVSDANKEAEAIVRRAEERAKVIISNDEITKAAKQQAADILNQAQARAKEIRSAASKYLDDVLLQSEETLQASLSNVRKKRQELRSLPSGSSKPVQPPKNGNN